MVDIYKSELNFRYNSFSKTLFMHLLVLAIIRKSRSKTAKLLQYFKNISDRFRNILAILQYFQEIFLQYFLNISVLCGIKEKGFLIIS